MSEWISVKDELPEDRLTEEEKLDKQQIKVLVSRVGCKNSVRTTTRVKKYGDSKWDWAEAWTKPTHWMFLPEPPKKE